MCVCDRERECVRVQIKSVSVSKILGVGEILWDYVCEWVTETEWEIYQNSKRGSVCVFCVCFVCVSETESERTRERWL
jgi:hypothetical protein